MLWEKRTSEKASKDREHKRTSESLSLCHMSVMLMLFHGVCLSVCGLVGMTQFQRRSRARETLQTQYCGSNRPPFLTHSLVSSIPTIPTPPFSRQIDCPTSLFGECPSTIRPHPPPLSVFLSLPPPILSVSPLDPCTLCLTLSHAD